MDSLIERIDSFWADLDARTDGPDELMNVKCRELARGYVEYWGDPVEQFEVEEIEVGFKLPILDPETGEDTGEWYQGFFDKVLVHKEDGVRYVMDHKTSGEAIDDFASGFWRRWDVNSQSSLYQLAMKQLGTDVGGLLVDAIKKPGIRPTKKDGGIEGYGKRLQENIAANPEKYYARQTSVRDEEQLLEALGDMHSVSLDVCQKRNNGRWHKNTTSCFAYGTACKFLGICSGMGDLDDPWWVKKDAPEDGIRAWSNSRINTYLTCPKKYYYEYEAMGHGVTKQETSESLAFGSLFHSYMDMIYGSEESDQEQG